MKYHIVIVAALSFASDTYAFGLNERTSITVRSGTHTLDVNDVERHRSKIASKYIDDSCTLSIICPVQTDNGDSKHFFSSRQRRKLILSSLNGFSAYLLSRADQSFADETQTSSLNGEPKECQNGGIVSESAVPGAYQQQCMDLSERSFVLKSTNDKIVIQQGGSTKGVAGRTGVAVWNSGIILTRLLDKINQIDSSVLKDKTVLELGCGAALASIAAEKLGASIVFATDNNSEVLSLAQRNIERNNASNAKTALLQWGLLDAYDFERAADVIIGSDLTYNPNTWRSLAESMVTILKPGGIVIYLTLGHSGFNVGGEVSGFTSVADNVGLQRATKTIVGNNTIESLLAQLLNADEKSVIDASGGVRVLVLTKR